MWQGVAANIRFAPDISVRRPKCDLNRKNQTIQCEGNYVRYLEYVLIALRINSSALSESAQINECREGEHAQ
jgi:hypothetical protein